ncbi:Hypothetical predicted protein [Pelobates cultripes]|uniref:Uncharacterized protein n=1 Tax=Pelobates cultripes TaxID=61616 RepID=A0AAD1SUY4_PELCU|nr:Hypothetical predicted protein [Pelobates cultripes]
MCRTDTKASDLQSRKHKKPQDGADEDGLPRLHAKSPGTGFGNMLFYSHCQTHACPAHVHSLQGNKRGSSTLQHTEPGLYSSKLNKRSGTHNLLTPQNGGYGTSATSSQYMLPSNTGYRVRRLSIAAPKTPVPLGSSLIRWTHAF